MALISQPTEGAVVDQAGNALPGYKSFLSRVFDLLVALTSSGPLAERPTAFLFVGRTYFDTSLGAHGKPIWYTTAGWVDATSTLV